jgi:hypothetical protein
MECRELEQLIEWFNMTLGGAVMGKWRTLDTKEDEWSG